MFDLISGGPRYPFHDRTMVPVVLSVTGHVMVISAAVLLTLMYTTDWRPPVPPMKVSAFVAADPVAPPSPPPPPAPQRPASKAAPAGPQPPPTTTQFAAPVESPSEIFPEPAAAAESIGIEGGVEGGVVGGVVTGIVGGLVGGALSAPPPPSPPPVTTPVRIGGSIQAPTLVHRVEPEYPDIAVVAKVRGVVILEATIGVDGTVESVRVLRRIKFLDQAAVDAVKQWRYSPLVLNGVPTPFVLSVTLNFSLKEG
jgi:protein TonB